MVKITDAMMRGESANSDAGMVADSNTSTRAATSVSLANCFVFKTRIVGEAVRFPWDDNVVPYSFGSGEYA
ncbi:MAG TPA: hypothetical protein DCO65_07930 [Spartobacteria bacterium]|nr:hypothetical protein [Spartobacteria bacterium]